MFPCVSYEGTTQQQVVTSGACTHQLRHGNQTPQ